MFTSDDVIQRADKFGDLFAPVLKLKQKLPALAKLADIGELALGARKSTAAKPRREPAKAAPQKSALGKPAATKRTAAKQTKAAKVPAKAKAASGRKAKR